MTGSEATLASLLEAGAPGARAFVTAESGEALTYEQLRTVVDELAASLASLGVGRASKVALVLPDGPQFVRLLLAVTSLGATAAPLNPAYKRDEYEFYLGDLAPELLLLPAGELQAARQAAGGAVQIVDVVEDGEIVLLRGGEPVGRGEVPERARPDDAALLL